jgi:pseudouridine synthase
MSPRNTHKPGIPDEFTDAARGIRIQKALADAGIASRREAEQMIEEGRVQVNGKSVTALPAWVDPANDRVTVDGKKVVALGSLGKGGRRVYIMLNKPRHTITTTNDPDGRTSVLDLVKTPGNARLFPIGRLDAESTGLLLLTNDGELGQQLTHPSYEVEKEYHVSVKGYMSDDDMQLLKHGLMLTTDPRKAPRASRHAPRPKRASVLKIRLISRGRSKGGNQRTRLSMTLAEGQNREIRRLLARLGFPVKRLERVKIGPLKLKGLASGEWRPLTSREVQQLRTAVSRRPPIRKPSK